MNIEKRSTATARILGIDWNQYSNLSFSTPGVRVVYASPEEAWEFLGTHYRQVHQLDSSEGQFLEESFDSRKKQYYEEFGDFFLLKKGDAPVGVLVGTLSDWSSYNIRSSTFVKEFQGAGLSTVLLNHVLSTLKNFGVCRAEADASPANLTSVQILTRARFTITGMTLSERWGALVHFTKFLQGDNQSIYRRQFCHGVTRE